MLRRNYSSGEVKGFKELGSRRALCERKLLSLMFDGFPTITLDDDGYDCVFMVHSECSLETHTVSMRKDVDNDYLSLPSEGKIYFHLIVALNELVKNELVTRNVICSHDPVPEAEFIDLSNNLSGSVGEEPAFQASALISSYNTGDRSFFVEEKPFPDDELPPQYSLEYIKYTLTTKGYDVAIRFLEHDDQANRFEEQAKISSLAAQAARSSSITAKIAVVAAFTIAFGSIANIAITLMIHYECI